MSGPDLKDYIEVPDRIRDFKEHFPEGSLQGSHEVVTLGDKTFIQYIARAYRNPTDCRPGVGTTWEPFPGTTPYTRNSEIENAETSAWGRALAALGFVGKKVASATEVRNRSAEQGESNIKPTEKQKALLKRLIGQKNVSLSQLLAMLNEVGMKFDELPEGWPDLLSGGKQGQMSALIDRLMNGEIPAKAPEAATPRTDAPADGDEFVHPPTEPLEVLS